jgi:hypothetical protein
MVVAQEGDTSFWKRFEGQSLEGRFPLDGYIGAGNGIAMFVSRLAGQEHPVLIKLVRYGSPGWDRLSASWTLAKQLEHANLIRVFATGQGDLDGLRVAYAITDFPDANVASVLQERCLTAIEGRELLLNCAEALRYLHQKGLVNTDVQPASIVSVNETIKLSVDHLMRAGERDGARQQADPYCAPETAREGYSPAGDVWSLGVSIQQAITGTLPNMAGEKLPLDSQGSCLETLRHCFAISPADRWSAGQIVNFLRSGGLPQQPRTYARMARVRYAVPAACILLVSAFWLIDRGGSSSAVPAAILPAQSDADRVKEAPATETPKPSAFKDSAKSGAVVKTWSVVVLTYAHAADAERKAAEIDGKWPELRAHVLAMNGGSRNLVVLGTGLSKEDALSLRDKALASGLPRDSYVQNF